MLYILWVYFQSNTQLISRAADWKLDTPDWSGRMRITAKGKVAYIKLEDKVSGLTFRGLNCKTLVILVQNSLGQQSFPGAVVESSFWACVDCPDFFAFMPLFHPDLQGSCLPRHQSKSIPALQWKQLATPADILFCGYRTTMVRKWFNAMTMYSICFKRRASLQTITQVCLNSRLILNSWELC